MRTWIIPMLALAFILSFLPIAIAVDFIPQGDINLRNVYTIKNWKIGNCSGTDVVHGILANGSWNCQSAGSGSGDITDVLAGSGIIVTNPGGPQPNVSLNTTYAAGIYQNRTSWSTHDDYPTACSSGQYVRGLGDTLTCSADLWNTSAELNTFLVLYKYYNFSYEIGWANLTAYPTACSSGQFIRGVGDTLTCASDLWNTTAELNSFLVLYRYFNFSSEIGWNNLTTYPSGCSAGNAITTLSDTPTCSPFQTGSELYNTTSDFNNYLSTWKYFNFSYEIGWANLTTYPAACSAGQFVTAVGDTLTCDTPVGGGGGVGDKWVDGGLYIYPNSTFANNTVIFGYINATDWSNVTLTNWSKQINNYPSDCTSGYFVRGLGDTLTCALDLYNSTSQVWTIVDNGTFAKKSGDTFTGQVFFENDIVMTAGAILYLSATSYISELVSGSISVVSDNSIGLTSTMLYLVGITEIMGNTEVIGEFNVTGSSILHNVTATNLMLTELTQGRIPFVGTNDLLTDSIKLMWNDASTLMVLDDGTGNVINLDAANRQVHIVGASGTSETLKLNDDGNGAWLVGQTTGGDFYIEETNTAFGSNPDLGIDDATGNMFINQTKFCLNGIACTKYIQDNGTNVLIQG